MFSQEGLKMLVDFGFVITFIIIIVIGVFVLGFYITKSIFLNKFNKLIYGKATIMAWIPICDLYLLGKLAVNKNVGLILCLMLLFVGVTFAINIDFTWYFLVRTLIFVLYFIFVISLIVYSFVKYFQMEK